jgi:hypothetical protein
MAARPKRKARTPKAESFEAVTTVVGPAFVMPDQAAEMFALRDDVPIDFQARQDKISETRRSPGPKLAPKVKRTTAKPSPAKETTVKI